jgi:hypothetical protein
MYRPSTSLCSLIHHSGRMELHDSGARESCVALPPKIDELQLPIDVKIQTLPYHYLYNMPFYGLPPQSHN